MRCEALVKGENLTSERLKVPLPVLGDIARLSAYLETQKRLARLGLLTHHLVLV